MVGWVAGSPAAVSAALIIGAVVVGVVLIALIAWLTLNHGDLTVFIHPNTGQDLEDHRDRAVWIGKSVPLVLDIFTKKKD